MIVASKMFKKKKDMYGHWSSKKTVICLATLLAASILYTCYNVASVLLLDQDVKMIMLWGGFRQEQGLYNFTVVTALMETADQSTHRYNDQLTRMQSVLRLDVNMVIYTDRKGKPFFEWMRRGRENRTKIVVMTLEDLPFYRLQGRVFRNETSRPTNSRDQVNKTRLHQSKKDNLRTSIFQLEKLYFVDRAVRENVFNTSFFIWINPDIHLGHNSDFPRSILWTPKGVFKNSDQITVIENLEADEKSCLKNHRFHEVMCKQERSPYLSGQVFAGSGNAFKLMYSLQKKLVDKRLLEGTVDNEQTIYSLLYSQRPSLFNLVQADNYNMFHLFADKSQQDSSFFVNLWNLAKWCLL